MFTKQITLDTGKAVFNLEVKLDARRTVFTAYLNNLSIRGQALHVERSRDGFIEAVCAAADCKTDADDARLSKEIEQFIIDNTTDDQQ